MNDSLQARNRKDATIAVAICTECYCSIPADQGETHARWHQERTAKAAK